MDDKFPYIGELNRKIKIVEMIKNRNSTGEEEISHNVIASPYSKMIDISGTEDVEGKIRHFIIRHYIIRWTRLLSLRSLTDLLVIDGNNKFNIYHSVEMGRNRMVKLLVKEYE
jgi:hypothetical protein